MLPSLLQKSSKLFENFPKRFSLVLSTCEQVVSRRLKEQVIAVIFEQSLQPYFESHLIHSMLFFGGLSTGAPDPL